MKPLLLVLLFFCWQHFTKAQFVLQPNPLHKNQFSQIAKMGYKICNKYKVENEVKILVEELKYEKGLPKELVVKTDEEVTETTNFQFNKMGQLTKELIVFKDGDDRQVVYMYNSLGNVATKYSLHADPATFLYKYNKLGRLFEIYVTVKMPEYDSVGNFTNKGIDVSYERQKIELNTANKIISKKIYNLRNEDSLKPALKYTYTYNAAGLVAKYQVVNSEFKNILVVNYFYNKEGLLIKSTEKNYNDDEVGFVYEYK